MYGARLTISRGYTILPESVKINPTKVSVSFVPPASASNPAGLRLLTNGEPEPDIDEARASEILKEEDLEVVVDLGDGAEEARVWTCDFSHVSSAGPVITIADVQEYVTINGSVRLTPCCLIDNPADVQYRS